MKTVWKLILLALVVWFVAGCNLFNTAVSDAFVIQHDIRTPLEPTAIAALAVPPRDPNEGILASIGTDIKNMLAAAAAGISNVISGDIVRAKLGASFERILIRMDAETVKFAAGSVVYRRVHTDGTFTEVYVPMKAETEIPPPPQPPGDAPE